MVLQLATRVLTANYFFMKTFKVALSLWLWIWHIVMTFSNKYRENLKRRIEGLEPSVQITAQFKFSGKWLLLYHLSLYKILKESLSSSNRFIRPPVELNKWETKWWELSQGTSEAQWLLPSHLLIMATHVFTWKLETKEKHQAITPAS